MKQIQILAVVVLSVFGFAAERAAAQAPTSIQRIFFSFLTDYEADAISSNSVLTITNSFIRTDAVTTGNVQRALYYDEAGQEWTNMIGMELVREVNLTNGAEGIYLRGNGRQTNVSQHFINTLGISYLDDFTSEVTNEFAGATNTFSVGLPIHRGMVEHRKGMPATTNNLRSETMFFISLNTTNMRFNFLALGTAVENPVAGRTIPNGVIYRTNIESFYAHGIGTLFHNGGSNIFDRPGVPPLTNPGVAYGAFWTGPPVFRVVTNGP